MNPNLIPSADPAGLPGPVWLFQTLLVVTFFLHLLFMNLAVGGSLLAWIAHVVARGRGNEPHGVLARRLTLVNGYGISLAITTGVAPLLFLQVLYHQLFYTGTILMGEVWLGMLGMLTAGYYAAYLYKLKGAPATGRGGGVWIGLSAVMFLTIAVVQVAVHLIQVQPDQWLGFAANPWRILADPTFVPRLLHFVSAGIGLSAVTMAWWAARCAPRSDDPATETAIARFCWKWAMWSTVVQVIDGFILLMVLPGPVLSSFMKGGPATMVPLALAILGAVGLLMMMSRVVDPIASRATVTGTLGAMVLVVAIMAVTRHQVREAYVAPWIDLGAFRVVPQWFNFGVFVVLLVAALAVVALMVRRVQTSPASGSEAA